MKNYIKSGDVLDHTPSSAVTGGQVVAMQDTAGVAVGDIASGETGAVAVTGMYEVAKVSGTAWTMGARLTWDTSAGGFVPTAGHTSDTGDIVDCAIAAADATSGATVGKVKLTNPGTVQ